MFLSPKGSLVVSIGKMYEKSKYVSLTNLMVAVFPKNDIKEEHPQVIKYEFHATQYSKQLDPEPQFRDQSLLTYFYD